MYDGKLDTDPKVDGDDWVHRSSQVTDNSWRCVKCLGHKLRRVNIVNYEGLQIKKILANFLLYRDESLEKFSVTSTLGTVWAKDEIARGL